MKFRTWLLACLSLIILVQNSSAYSPETQTGTIRPTLKIEQVFYNTNSQIYHNLNCIWAKKCTKNCILLDKSEAMTRGRACKVCGG